MSTTRRAKRSGACSTARRRRGLRPRGATRRSENGASLRFARIELRRQTKQTVRSVLGRAEVPQLEDPGEQRAASPRHERAARDGARALPRAATGPDRHQPARHARQDAARGGARLPQRRAGWRPDRVFGVYRVPDRISRRVTPHSEKGRVVEWDVVHAPTRAGTLARASSRPSFARRRAVGRAAPRASRRCSTRTSRSRSACRPGSAPSAALGLARDLASSARCTAAARRADPVCTLVRGVVAIHPHRVRGRRSSACARPRRCTCAAPARRPRRGPQLGRDRPRPSTRRSATRRRCRRRSRTCRRRRRSCCARTSRSSASQPADCLQRAGDGRPGPPARAGRRHADERRAQAAVRRRQGADARARLPAGRGRLPRPPRVRRGPRALGGVPATRCCRRGSSAARRRGAGSGSRTSSAACSARSRAPRERVERLHWDNWFEGAGEEPPPYRYCWPPIR